MIKIFIMEDDPLLVGLYQKAFEQAGYEVETAFNGADGLEKLSKMEKKPTLILSDIMMPKMNGLEALEKIKSDKELKNIPVIMLTNLSGDKDAERALSLGAVTYLIKSQYEPKEIVAKVKEIVSAYSRGSDIPEVKTTIKDIKKDKKPGG